MALEQRWTDKTLGMDRPITRRDFMDGIAVAIGATGMASVPAGTAAMQLFATWPQDQPGYYPPALRGLRGSHPGSFENAHALRDGGLRD
ncbi:MAG: twin-arginine translocation signal domain-containing protein, partial [Acetobacteraceae bacterium]|nr:twin-arginine translocation signal domain-containing protein [Acetobacteraceae bacterium]